MLNSLATAFLNAGVTPQDFPAGHEEPVEANFWDMVSSPESYSELNELFTEGKLSHQHNFVSMESFHLFSHLGFDFKCDNSSGVLFTGSTVFVTVDELLRLVKQARDQYEFPVQIFCHTPPYSPTPVVGVVRLDLL